jgi:hypothetical protein
MNDTLDPIYIGWELLESKGVHEPGWYLIDDNFRVAAGPFPNKVNTQTSEQPNGSLTASEIIRGASEFQTEALPENGRGTREPMALEHLRFTNG